jgi:predicted nucleic acid-binding protein
MEYRAGRSQPGSGVARIIHEASTAAAAGTVTLSEQVLEALASILTLPNLSMVYGSLVEEAIDLARKSGQEFADAYIVASAKITGAQGIATFNIKHFQNLGAKLHRF